MIILINIIFCLFYNPWYLYFIFITFLLWHIMLTSVWWTPLFMLGGLKCYTSIHTYPFVCSQHVVSGHWYWTVFDLQAQMYLYLLRSSDPNMVTKFLSSLVQGMACHQFGTSHCLNQLWYIVNWNIRSKVMLNHISNMNSLCCSNLLENVICKTVAILFRPWCFK